MSWKDKCENRKSFWSWGRVTRLGGLPPWLSVELSVPRRVDAPASARAGVGGKSWVVKITVLSRVVIELSCRCLQLQRRKLRLGAVTGKVYS